MFDQRWQVVVVIALATAPSLPGQIGVPLPAGYAGNVHALPPPPAFVSLTAVETSGAVLVFDGSSLVRIDATGAVTPVHTPAITGFAEVLVIEPGGATALLALSPSYELLRIDLTLGTGAVVSTLPYLYDLDFTAGGDLYGALGAATFSTTTLEHIDLAAMTRQVFAALAGATGPMVARPDGSVVYGTNDFGRPSQALLEFSAPLVAGALGTGTPLDEADATILVSGLAGTTGLALDGDLDLYLTENDFLGGASRLLAIDTTGMVTSFALAPPGFFFARISLAPETDPFVAASGPGRARMATVLSDFFAASFMIVAEPTNAGGLLFGDCNLDGQVSSVDALLGAQVGVGQIALAHQARAQCDVDGGGLVDVIDALAIAQYAVGLPVTLGY